MGCHRSWFARLSLEVEVRFMSTAFKSFVFDEDIVDMLPDATGAVTQGGLEVLFEWE